MPGTKIAGMVPVVYFDPDERWDRERLFRAKRLYNEYLTAKGRPAIDFIVKNISFPEPVSEVEIMNKPLFTLQLLRATITCESVLEHKYIGQYRDSVVAEIVLNRSFRSPIKQKNLVEIASSLPGKWYVIKAGDELDLQPDEVSRLAASLTSKKKKKRSDVPVLKLQKAPPPGDDIPPPPPDEPAPELPTEPAPPIPSDDLLVASPRKTHRHHHHRSNRSICVPASVPPEDDPYILPSTADLFPMRDRAKPTKETLINVMERLILGAPGFSSEEMSTLDHDRAVSSALIRRYMLLLMRESLVRNANNSLELLAQSTNGKTSSKNRSYRIWVDLPEIRSITTTEHNLFTDFDSLLFLFNDKDSVGHVTLIMAREHGARNFVGIDHYDLMNEFRPSDRRRVMAFVKEERSLTKRPEMEMRKHNEGWSDSAQPNERDSAVFAMWWAHKLVFGPLDNGCALDSFNLDTINRIRAHFAEEIKQNKVFPFSQLPKAEPPPEPKPVKPLVRVKKHTCVRVESFVDEFPEPTIMEAVVVPAPPAPEPVTPACTKAPESFVAERQDEDLHHVFFRHGDDDSVPAAEQEAQPVEPDPARKGDYYNLENVDATKLQKLVDTVADIGFRKDPHKVICTRSKTLDGKQQEMTLEARHLATFAPRCSLAVEAFTWYCCMIQDRSEELAKSNPSRTCVIMHPGVIALWKMTNSVQTCRTLIGESPIFRPRARVLFPIQTDQMMWSLIVVQNGPDNNSVPNILHFDPCNAFSAINVGYVESLMQAMRVEYKLPRYPDAIPQKNVLMDPQCDPLDVQDTSVAILSIIRSLACGQKLGMPARLFRLFRMRIIYEIMKNTLFDL